MYIDVVTKEIDDARKTIKNLQPTIRAFVTNKDFPLEERYRVWSEYAEKESQCYIVGGLIGEYLGEMCAYAYIDRYSTIGYDDLVTMISDDFSKLEEDEVHICFESVEQLKEELIKTNYGSCEIDW